MIPIHRSQLAPHERISLRQAERHLGHHACYVVHPLGLPLPPEVGGFRALALSPRNFRSVATYSRMLLRRRFWQYFAAYDQVLIYQLDCLVFGADLAPWRGYSYVGAPWPRRRGGFVPKAVGNGGLSLHAVGDALDVLGARRARLLPRYHQCWLYIRRAKYLLRWCRRLIGARLAARRDGRPVGFHLARRFDENEDVFWSYFAPQLLDRYRLPTPRTALGFAMEQRPRQAFAANGGRLPFGCHAWHQFDAAFWAGFLREDGGPA